MIEIQGMSKEFGRGSTRQGVLDAVDLCVSSGDFLAIVGESGCGKTTLLNILGGLDRSFRGSVRVAGHDLAALSDRSLSKVRNESIGFVFQHFNLLDHLTVSENVALPGVFAEQGHADPPKRASACLEKVGLADRRKDLARDLSGGQKQRVAIARALYNDPVMLLCDEPTGNLDKVTGRQIIDLFESLNQEAGITLIIVTHEDRIAARAGRVLRMSDGHLVPEEGTYVG
ncbi:MAG: ABC transporter ATP-binding protein [Deltaproteobacteria bacterium]|nr:ABC transporter ATP-binding protein [Deltaproteobacteria bacterium]